VNILEDLCAALAPLGIPVETGVFTQKPPDTFAVLTPLTEEDFTHGDGAPLDEVQEARLSLYTKGNYLALRREVIHAVRLHPDLLITARRYVGHEDDSGYHHYAIDVAKQYETEDF